MTDRIAKMKEYFIIQKEHYSFRQKVEDPYALAEFFSSNNVPYKKRAVLRAKYVLDNEKPVVFENERITLLIFITQRAREIVES